MASPRVPRSGGSAHAPALDTHRRHRRSLERGLGIVCPLGLRALRRAQAQHLCALRVGGRVEAAVRARVCRLDGSPACEGQRLWRLVEAEEQRRADNRDRGEGHRRARKHRRELDVQPGVEHAGGERNANHIVDEGPDKVDPDATHRDAREVERRDDVLQRALHQDHVCRLDSHVRPRPDCDADVGGRKRGRVVDAVAHETNLGAGFAQLLHLCELAGGLDACHNARSVQARLGRDMRCGALIVARDHPHLDAALLQLLHHRARVGLERIRDGQRAGEKQRRRSVFHLRHGGALAGPLHRRHQLRRRRRPDHCRQAGLEVDRG
mmetsp:Transcript_39002/g.126077  ORF Transcript_39002/g.126077 Transcript_39002/m.126077 type:complete len:323 (+) Transcript_39002:89-1057(+)